MGLTITESQLLEARAYHAAGELTQAYQILAAAGDKYAAAAAEIVDGTYDLFENTVKNLWEVVDPGSVAEKWFAVAERHQSNYLDLIEQNNNGDGTYTLPRPCGRI